jgi:hypothetical protein
VKEAKRSDVLVRGDSLRKFAVVPRAFKAITTLPQPTSFSALVKASDGECPCCPRRFTDTG